jgi:crotonobetainyl-CoA:carnitine CoA-transferase CaiB-like acyl-CoA transferase
MRLYGGRQIPRMGLSHAAIAPYDAYPTADGQILIGVQNDRGWRTLVSDVFGLFVGQVRGIPPRPAHRPAVKRSPTPVT